MLLTTSDLLLTTCLPGQLLATPKLALQRVPRLGRITGPRGLNLKFRTGKGAMNQRTKLSVTCTTYPSSDSFLVAAAALVPLPASFFPFALLGALWFLLKRSFTFCMSAVAFPLSFLSSLAFVLLMFFRSSGKFGCFWVFRPLVA